MKTNSEKDSKNNSNSLFSQGQQAFFSPKSTFFSPTIQTKLEVGSPNDKYEQEADSVADRVINNAGNSSISESSPGIQRKCAACEEEEKVQRKHLNITPIIQKSGNEGGGVANDAISIQIAASKGGGTPMGESTKSFMENRFGNDFSGIRIHTDSNAIQLSQNLDAQAFTVGNDVFFNQGKYSPDSDSGKHLLAHELTHTVQQNGGMPKAVQTKPKSKYVEGGGATPGVGEGIDVVFIINSPDDEFTGDVVKYIQNTLSGQEYYIVDGLDGLFYQLNRIATGFEYHYVPIVDEMKLPPSMERLSDIKVAPRKVRRIRLVAHGQTVIGGVKMLQTGGKEKSFVPPDEIVKYSQQPHIQKIVQNVMTPDAVVEFWGCNIGAVPAAGAAWSNLFQSEFKAIKDTFKTGFDKFYRRPDKGETGEIVDGIKGEVVQVLNSSEVKSRNKGLISSFNKWLLKRYNEFAKNGDILPIKGKKDQLIYMEDLFNKSNGDLKYIQVERKSDEKLIRPGDVKDWKKLWVEFSPVKIGSTP